MTTPKEDSRPLLQVVICSTRPGRVGAAIGQAFYEAARQADSAFEIELVDLRDVALPLLDEPRHPRFGDYQHAHTRAWSNTVSRAQAFVFVTPEYNYAPPPSLVNALDYLHAEWAYKPAGFASYGGVSGGTRAVQVAKQIVTTLRMVPLQEAFVVPNFAGQMTAEGGFTANEIQQRSVVAMLQEAFKLVGALRPLQAPARCRDTAQTQSKEKTRNSQ